MNNKLMTNYYCKIIFCLFIILAAIFSVMSIRVSADIPSQVTIICDNESQKLIADNSDFLYDISDASPGDNIIGYLNFDNKQLSEKTIYLYMKNISSDSKVVDLLDKINITLEMNENSQTSTLYDGPLSNLTKIKDINQSIKLGTIKPQEKGILKTTLRIPDTLGNECKLSEINLIWSFFINELPKELPTPIITPPGGIYYEEQHVTIICPVNDAIIHYTLDGTEPDVNSPIYSKEIFIDKNIEIKAKAYKDGYIPSDTKTEDYEFQTPPPDITPGESVYDGYVYIKITSKIPGANLYYTTDETIPTKDSLHYTEPFLIEKNTVVKAIAIVEGWNKSDKAQEQYQIRAPKPQITPETGFYKDKISVSINCSDPNVIIRYTTDGSDVTDKSPVYTGPFDEDKDCTVKARSYKPGLIESLQAVEQYVFEVPGQVTTPIITPPGGKYENGVYVTISCGTKDADIYYTIDGSEPDENSLIYSTPVLVNENTVIKAKAYADKLTPSKTAEEEYFICVSTPVISPPGGRYLSSVTVSITCDTPDAKIYYTIDGTIPDKDSIPYIGPFTIPDDITVRAIAVKDGMTDSEEAKETYDIYKNKVSTPQAIPAGGIYSNPQDVTIICATDGAIIYYTTDNSMPTRNSNVYTKPIPIDKNTTIKAIAVKDDCDDSDIMTEIYEINIPTIIKTGLTEIFNENKSDFILGFLLGVFIIVFVIRSIVLKNKEKK